MLRAFRFRLIVVGSLALAVGLFAACSRQDGDAGGPGGLVAPADKAGGPRGTTHYGPTVPVGHGTARTFIATDRDGTPLSVGIDLSAKALSDLPAGGGSWVLRFHPGGLLPYTHVYLDWNPNGHEPPGIYDVPHFDVHFYFIPVADRLAIGADDTLQFANAPDPMYIPSDYMQIPGGVPQMGAHWVDLLAPEFNGQPFTRTFLWGSYDGTSSSGRASPGTAASAAASIVVEYIRPMW